MPKPRRKASQTPDSRYDGRLCAGHLLIWTWRKLVAGQVECPILAKEFMTFPDGRGMALLEAFGIFLQALGAGSRRLLAVGQPRVAGITGDEAQMLRLIAAAQNRNEALIAAHLAWLVRGQHVTTVERSARHLAGILLECGVVLPPAAAVPPPERARLEMLG
jgi:hypothetical protein